MSDTTELTEAQKKKIPKYREKWLKIGTRTTKCKPKKAIAALKLCYEKAGLTPPPDDKFFGPFNNPYECALKQKEITGQSLSQCLNEQIYGLHEASWLSIYDFIHNELKKDCSKLDGLMAAAKEVGWWAPYDEACFYQHPPKAVHYDEQNRLHNVDGPAIEYYGDDESCNIYSIHGVTVEKKIVERDYTWEDIDSQPNAEVRRVMIELYGQSKYLIDSKAEVVNEDDFGTLYRKRLENDEDLWMVKVTNSTPEADGSFKDYFIRVDPNAYGGLKTAHAAVASTWRNSSGEFIFEKPEDYKLSIQS